MPCTTCGSDFGIFKKEVGCAKCGFSFCSKCCTKRTFTSDNGESYKQIACLKCYNKLTSNKSSVPEYSPPLAYKKRMAALGNRSMSLGASPSKPYEEHEEDKQIAERLQKLKRERNKELPPSQDEIEKRLAKLKGMDPAKYTAPPIQVFRPDRRSSAEQTSDLINQIVEEVQIDANVVKPEDEIASRLARLRGEPEPPPKTMEDIDPSLYAKAVPNPEKMDIDEVNESFASAATIAAQQACRDINSLMKDPDVKKALVDAKLKKQKEDVDEEASEELDEEKEADMIIEKLLAVNMEEEDPENLNGARQQSQSDSLENNGNKDTDDDDEEFPWCVICTEDAKIRCFGCDDDLYCMRCFKECHDSLDIKDHKTCPFLQPKTA